MPAAGWQEDVPDIDDVVQIGTLVTINRKFAASDGAHIFVRGQYRARSLSMDFLGSYASARVEVLRLPPQESVGIKLEEARSVF